MKISSVLWVNLWKILFVWQYLKSSFTRLTYRNINLIEKTSKLLKIFTQRTLINLKNSLVRKQSSPFHRNFTKVRLIWSLIKIQLENSRILGYKFVILAYVSAKRLSSSLYFKFRVYVLQVFRIWQRNYKCKFMSVLK